MTEKAYAKINLSLVVCGRRDNGYHDLKMVMETVSICDDLIIERSEVPGIHLTCEMDEELARRGIQLGSGDDNLIVRAGRALLEYAKERGITDTEAVTPDGTPGYEITLMKRIPMAAGLAGGSSDAAAALRGIASMLNAGAQKDGGSVITYEDLCLTGAREGADIPYCIRGGSCRAEGIGEILTPLPPVPEAYLLIVKPDIDVPTGRIFTLTDANTDYRSSDRQQAHDRFDRLTEGLYEGDLSKIAGNLYNDLRFVTVGEYPVIAEIENRLLECGALGAMMSGSGPSVFGIFEDKNACLQAEGKIRASFPDIYVSEAGFI